MKTKKEIVDEAKKSYDKIFKDPKEIPGILNEGHDVVLDKEKLIHDIKEKEIQEEHEQQSLKTLRKKLTKKADESYEKIFGSDELK